MSWTVGSVMTRDVVSVSPGAPYKDVAGKLREHRVSAVPVVDANQRVLGIVSEADLLLKEERPPHRPGGPLVHPYDDEARAMARNAAALMTAPVVTVRPEATLTEAARLMHRQHVKRLPVVDARGALVGIVSRADLLRVFLRSDESIAAEVRDHVLAGTLAIEPDEVQVGVDDGVVRLEGQLETRGLVRILVRLVAAVEGVVGVDDRLRWRLGDTAIGPGDGPRVEQLAADERRGT
ncbi:MAG TPA: CBS domain-containing protein [Candidatus Dormibacteraeota bacterium]|nr:CBS domain-containing protein [Candidatus Dormibacteraeota bacterium]